MNHLDDPARGEQIAAIIRRKPALYQWYCDVYRRYAAALARCPEEGLAIELGAGGGFARKFIPELCTADVLPYSMVDLVFDACRMPFADQSVRFFCMLNVFHHIPDAKSFLSECQRCLVPGGRVLIVDQYPGLIGRWIFRYMHHEPFLPDAEDWSFPSTGPLSGANGALAWIVFLRDREAYTREFPHLSIESVVPRSPLQYWLSGGLKSWTLIPSALTGLAGFADKALLKCSPRFGSFMDVELTKDQQRGKEGTGGVVSL